METKPHPQGSESDLGLVPGGRVKLVRSTALDTVRCVTGDISDIVVISVTLVILVRKLVNCFLSCL